MAHGGRAGECDLVHVVVQGQWGSGAWTKAAQNVHHTLRKPNLLNKLAHGQASQRSLLTGLHNHSAPGGKSRPQLPGLHQQWEIPRNDLANNANRLVASVAKHLSIHRNGLALKLVGPASIIPVALDHQMQVSLRAVGCVFPGLAVVQCLQSRQEFLVFFNGISEPQHQIPASSSIHLAPRRPDSKRGFRRCHGQINICAIRVFAMCNDLLSRGIDRWERFSRLAFHEFTVNKVASLKGPCHIELA
mmetsp:Transcript_2466/g.5642  ORF Transcript_2466/g.5642 Transcript_2466/m.5642 type:complete len:246 (+) Transcript_2466:815-1552(+)